MSKVPKALLRSALPLVIGIAMLQYALPLTNVPAMVMLYASAILMPCVIVLEIADKYKVAIGAAFMIAGYCAMTALSIPNNHIGTYVFLWGICVLYGIFQIVFPKKTN